LLPERLSATGSTRCCSTDQVSGAGPAVLKAIAKPCLPEATTFPSGCTLQRKLPGHPDLPHKYTSSVLPPLHPPYRLPLACRPVLGPAPLPLLDTSAAAADEPQTVSSAATPSHLKPPQQQRAPVRVKRQPSFAKRVPTCMQCPCTLLPSAISAACRIAQHPDPPSTGPPYRWLRTHMSSALWLQAVRPGFLPAPGVPNRVSPILSG